MTQSAERDKLSIFCARCGSTLAPLAQSCPRCPDALPCAVYAERRFRPLERGGIFRFAAWLPPTSVFDTEIGPVIVRHEGLAAALGLTDLAVAFSGYAPELGARNATGTFKDFEALPTLLYLREHGVDAVVLASAGNTARAFAHAASLLDFAAYIVVPESASARLRIPARPSESVRPIVVSGSNDYAAAIRLAAAVAEHSGMASEGGARNVARRDGMGTVVLEYARTQGRLPDHYVQAVGSGTGAIAAWEAAMRLVESGAVSGAPPRLHLAQNAPFTPVHDAWTRGGGIEAPGDRALQLRRIGGLSAPTLANRTPPFSVVGGVRDALAATSGRTYAVTNAEIAACQALFKRRVGAEIAPEGGAALAALAQGVARGWIHRADAVLLHITGSSDARLEREAALRPVPVWRRVPADLRGALRALAPDLERRRG